MKYVMLIYQPANYDPKGMSPEQHQSVAKQYAEVTATDGVEPGLPLGLTKDAITVRMGEGGRPETSKGPYVDEAGAVGGYFVFDAETEEQAIELASRVPAASLGGAVEIRPAQAYW